MIYKFTFVPRTSKQGIIPEKHPIIPQKPEGMPDTRKNIQLDDEKDVYSYEDIKQLLPPGFKTMDEAMKQYFSNIIIPIKNEGLKKVKVRISGGEKAFLAQFQDMIETGRIELPVIGIHRTGGSFDPRRFTPAYNPMIVKSANRGNTRATATYRPVPYNLDYMLHIWGERKADVEYILYDILSRFNPVAQWYIEDEHLSSYVLAKLNNYSNVSDIEATPEEHTKMKYDVSMTIEGYLPLPEKTQPVILGKVTVLKEENTAYVPNGSIKYGDIIAAWKNQEVVE